MSRGDSLTPSAAYMPIAAILAPIPYSLPNNQLVAQPGTPLADQPALPVFEIVRTIATVRISMPRAVVRLSAGRDSLDSSTQALCFLAGANSIFYGDTLLTTPNPAQEQDLRLLEDLGLDIKA